MMSDLPRVFLVGAGPGHPGLITLRGAECLARADIVLYDKLLPTRLLDHAPQHAERICVTDFGPCHAERCSPVIQKVIEAAREGKCVVRLKGGDPFLFGRGGEEADALRQAGISFEVVPGVTAALGVAAYAGIPLTHRELASAVAFVTGHENPAKAEPTIDWGSLANFSGTLVVYMGLARLDSIARKLIEHGKPADSPAAVIQNGATGEQRTITAPLREIAAAVRAADLASPALIVVGPTVALREHLTWFEQRPLFGRRVLVCRPRVQARELAWRLEELGATVRVMPVVEIRPPAHWGPVDAALDHIADFQWLVFTSANGVQYLLDRVRQRGRDLRILGGLRLAAIGPATAAALRSFHLEPDLVPEEYQSESLAAALAPHVAGQRVLLGRADRGREVLREQLQTIADVHQVAVYSQVDVEVADPEVLGLLRSGEIDEVILTSSNIVRALDRLLDAPSQARLRSGETGIVTISPVTSATVRELGYPVAAEATEYTMAGVVQALVKIQKRGRDCLPVHGGAGGGSRSQSHEVRD